MQKSGNYLDDVSTNLTNRNESQQLLQLIMEY